MKTILVTGANGFVGRHLVKELHSKGHKVIGVGGPNGTNTAENSYLSEYRVCDLTNESDVRHLDFHGIDTIIHLAGLASAQLSFAQPARFISDNGAISINLLEALLQQKARPRVIVVSSGAVYSPRQPMPIAEDGEVMPSSPYVVSKLLTENVCDYYRTRGIECIVVRPFNHIGPGQGPGFLLPDLTSQIREAIRDNKDLLVGNLSTKRDYTDVRDVARAYCLLATAETLKHNLYNVCSGTGTAGEYFLEALLDNLVTDKRPTIAVDQNRFRPNDAPEIVGNATRLRDETGWRPETPLEQTVKDFIAESAEL